MTDNGNVITDRIKKAADALKQLRPVYAPLLSFYEQIFIAQENSKADIDLDPIQISEEIVALKRNEALPLINLSDFIVDAEAGKELLIKICKIIKVANPEMADSAKAILKAVGDKITPKTLFAALLNGDDVYFQKTAENAHTDKNALAFVVYNSMKPSLVLCAEQLSNYPGAAEKWEKEYCPICGSYPGISMLDTDGNRLLCCSFCWHEWEAARNICPYCGNDDRKTHRYFYSDEEKSYRVDVCESCNKYIKTVDKRQAERSIYPPLEQVSTLHLDIKAQELGFESGIQLHLKF